MPRPPRQEEGFALVAALLALLLFALFAYTVIAADHGAAAEVDAQVQRARMQAAAEGAVATLVADIARSDARTPLGGVRTLSIGDYEVQAVMEDERGKVPLNGLKPDQVRRLLQAAGVSGRRLDILVDSLLEWQDGQERPNGPRIIDYAAEGVRARGGPMRTAGELMVVHGMDAELVSRLTPAFTLFADPRGEFEAAGASPLARAAMVDPMAPRRAAAGPALSPQNPWVGRPLAIHMTVSDGQGASYRQSEIVELTGLAAQPVWVRAVD